MVYGQELSLSVKLKESPSVLPKFLQESREVWVKKEFYNEAIEILREKGYLYEEK